MFIITIYTCISINTQKKRREMVKYEWKGMLIIQDDKCDVSRSCGVHWWTVGGIDQVLIGGGNHGRRLSHTLLMHGSQANLWFDLLSLCYLCLHDYLWVAYIGRAGRIPYMVEVNDIEGLYQWVRDISGFTTNEWAWCDGSVLRSGPVRFFDFQMGQLQPV